MKKFRKLYHWFYNLLKGHLPPGTLVRFRPSSLARDELLSKLGQNPGFEAVGIVTGGWRRFRGPGYNDFGTRVMFGERTCDVYHWDLEVIDESG